MLYKYNELRIAHCFTLTFKYNAYEILGTFATLQEGIPFFTILLIKHPPVLFSLVIILHKGKMNQRKSVIRI